MSKHKINTSKPVAGFATTELRPGERSEHTPFRFGSLRDAIVNPDVKALREKGRVAALLAETLHARREKAKKTRERLTKQRDHIIALMVKNPDSASYVSWRSEAKDLNAQIAELTKLIGGS